MFVRKIGTQLYALSGNIDLYYSPGGHGVRIDSHCYGGYTIPPNYDSMIAKVITLHPRAGPRSHGPGPRQYLIRGINTNISFARAIIRDPEFRKSEATTKFIEEFFDQKFPSLPQDLNLNLSA